MQWDLNQGPDQPPGAVKKEKAIFVTFNAVECVIPQPYRSYLIYISNDGDYTSRSNPLPFVPYNPDCRTCTISQTSKNASCYIKVSSVSKGSLRSVTWGTIRTTWLFKTTLRDKF